MTLLLRMLTLETCDYNEYFAMPPKALTGLSKESSRRAARNDLHDYDGHDHGNEGAMDKDTRSAYSKQYFSSLCRFSILLGSVFM